MSSEERAAATVYAEEANGVAHEGTINFTRNLSLSRLFRLLPRATGGTFFWPEGVKLQGPRGVHRLFLNVLLFPAGTRTRIRSLLFTKHWTTRATRRLLPLHLPFRIPISNIQLATRRVKRRRLIPVPIRIR